MIDTVIFFSSALGLLWLGVLCRFLEIRARMVNVWTLGSVGVLTVNERVVC